MNRRGRAPGHAVVEFADGRYEDTVAILHPIRKIVHRFGGSNAQRDVVARTLLEAAIRAGNGPLARALVSERLAVKDRARTTAASFSGSATTRHRRVRCCGRVTTRSPTKETH